MRLSRSQQDRGRDRALLTVQHFEPAVATGLNDDPSIATARAIHGHTLRVPSSFRRPLGEARSEGNPCNRRKAGIPVSTVGHLHVPWPPCPVPGVSKRTRACRKPSTSRKALKWTDVSLTRQESGYTTALQCPRRRDTGSPPAKVAGSYPPPVRFTTPPGGTPEGSLFPRRVKACLHLHHRTEGCGKSQVCGIRLQARPTPLPWDETHRADRSPLESPQRVPRPLLNNRFLAGDRSSGPAIGYAVGWHPVVQTGLVRFRRPSGRLIRATRSTCRSHRTDNGSADATAGQASHRGKPRPSSRAWQAESSLGRGRLPRLRESPG